LNIRGGRLLVKEGCENGENSCYAGWETEKGWREHKKASKGVGVSHKMGQNRYGVRTIRG